MATSLVVVAAFALMGVLLLAVLGAVHRREKQAFVVGILLITVAESLAGGTGSGTVVAGIAALIGVVAVIASTIPLLRQSATTG